MLNLPIKFISSFLFTATFMLLLTSCNGRPKGVLNQRDMAGILTEMYKTDASMSEKNIVYNHYSDKAPYYKYILKKYGITQAQFDSSLVWYTKNPRVFGNIYDNVLVNLTALQKDVKNGKYHPVDTLDLTKMKTNIWNKRTKYLLTKDSTRTHLSFEITDNNLMYGDAYVLKFLQRIAPEDSCKKQRIVLRINYVNGKTDSVSRTTYNDSLLRRYTFRLSATRKLKIKSVSGELLSSKIYKGKLNSLTDSISLMREFNMKKQDSLRRVVQEADPKFKLIQKKTNMGAFSNIKKSINRRFNHPVQ